jgi:hypothetical protein
MVKGKDVYVTVTMWLCGYVTGIYYHRNSRTSTSPIHASIVYKHLSKFREVRIGGVLVILRRVSVAMDSENVWQFSLASTPCRTDTMCPSERWGVS